MAVEANHLHLLPSHLSTNRDQFAMAMAMGSQGDVYNTQMGFHAPISGSSTFVPFTATASNSSLTFNDLSSANCFTRKRPRELDRRLSFVDDEIISSHIQEQQLEMDQLITHHVENARLELSERRRRFMRQILVMVEEGVSKRLKAKEEEMEKIGRLNSALEERVNSLFLENQLWRELAWTNEAAANLLRTNLEKVIKASQAAAVTVKKEEISCDQIVEDAESCYDAAETREESTLSCRGCRESERSVLLLPCRHLCLCVACARKADVCPICRCNKNGSVNVNLF